MARLACSWPATSARSAASPLPGGGTQPSPPAHSARGRSPRRWQTTSPSEEAGNRRAPRTTAASGRLSAGSITGAPVWAAASTMGRTPRTGRSAPSRDSSPRSHACGVSAGTSPAAISTPAAIARSRRAPSFRSSAGDKLTTMLLVSIWQPRWRIAARTRSRASRTAGSGRPTTARAGSPGRASTSTWTRRASTPRGTAE